MKQNKIIKINKIIDSFKRKKRLNCNFLISNSDSVLISESIGFSSFNKDLKLCLDNIFEISSLSKSFVTLIILFLEQNKKLNIKDDVQKYIPNFPYKDIKIENLLTHTSGLSDYRTDESILKYLISKNDITNHGVLNYFLDVKPNLHFASGCDWHYSNTGYILLTLIIEIIEKLPLSEVLFKLILQPLGLNSTKIPLNYEEVKKDENAVSYYISDKKKQQIDDASLLHPELFNSIGKLYGDCGIYSSVSDLNVFLIELTSNHFIPKEIVEKCFTDFSLCSGIKCEYGYGWMVFETNKGKVVSHSGSLSGCSSMMVKFIEMDLNLIFLSNFDNISSYRDIFIPEVYKVIMS
jgi:CubicO group peptidase (beta-lactamase class C family)